MDTDVPAQRQGHECAQLLFSKKVPSPPKNRKNACSCSSSCSSWRSPNSESPPSAASVIECTETLCIYDIPSSASPPQNLSIFCLARGIFPSLLFARSPAHCQRVNGTNPSQIISEEPSAPLFQRRAIMYGRHLNSVSPLCLWSSAHFWESEE